MKKQQQQNVFLSKGHFQSFFIRPLNFNLIKYSRKSANKHIFFRLLRAEEMINALLAFKIALTAWHFSNQRELSCIIAELTYR